VIIGERCGAVGLMFAPNRSVLRLLMILYCRTFSTYCIRTFAASSTTDICAERGGGPCPCVGRAWYINPFIPRRLNKTCTKQGNRTSDPESRHTGGSNTRRTLSNQRQTLSDQRLNAVYSMKPYQTPPYTGSSLVNLASSPLMVTPAKKTW
jgi:hypothetical protein